MKGRVKWWNSSSRCGFIEIGDDEEIFVHLADDSFPIYDEEMIEFSIETKSEGIFIYNIKAIA